MFANYLNRIKKQETIILGVLLYFILLVYTFQFFKIAGKYKPFTTDEFFYYIEAKAISSDNVFRTPASLDGNTSYIGDFGFHGISYALKDGLFSKIFFQSENPPLLLINFLTALAAILLILLYKKFDLKRRFKIAIIVATHYIFFSYTLSYMQETVQFLFAVIALGFMFEMYNYKESLNTTNKQVYYFIAIVIISITFRYSWFLWAAGLLPLSKDIKSFLRWSFIGIALTLFGFFINRYIMAPFPYNDILADRLIRSDEFSIIETLKNVYQKFIANILLYFTPADSLITTCMRYLLFILLVISIVYSFIKKNKFTIACTLIGWAYFLSTLAFYQVYWAYDERVLAVMTPLLAFSVVSTHHAVLFYLVLAVQLFLFPAVVKETSDRNLSAINTNLASDERTSRKTSYSKIKDLILDEDRTVISIGVGFVIHGSPDYFLDLPLVNSKGYPLHYRMYLKGSDLRQNQKIKYVLNVDDTRPNVPNELIYADKWMHLYKITN
jgi:hypothetical protein